MKHWLKSNSILIAVDLPGYQEGNRRGLAFIGLNDSFGFGTSVNRNSAGQIGSQKLAFTDPSIAPDIDFDLSFIPTRKFLNENILGLNFNFNNEYTSIFEGRSDTSFNVYLFISDKQSYDFIQQIRDQQTLNGVECIAIGNCYITRYGFSMAAADLARSTAAFVGSNMEASVISNNQVKVPAINLDSGAQNNYYLALDWAQIQIALDELTAAAQPILPTTEIKFSAALSNLEIPSAILTPLRDAKIQSLELGVTIDRETSYGFGSNFPRGRKIKYPVKGEIGISALVSNFSSGNFTGLMGGEQKYDVRLDFLDPQEVFLSGKSFAELTGFMATGVSGVTGMFTESRSLKAQQARLDSYRQSFPINDFVMADMSLSFQCYESGGLMQKYGVLTDGAQPWHLYTTDSRALYDPSGNILTTDPYLYIYTTGCERAYLLDGNNNLILADNWTDQENACLYDVSPAPDPDMLVASDSGSFVQLNWQASSPVDRYAPFISEDGGFTYVEIPGHTVTTQTSYQDTYVPRGNESFYVYRVEAYFGSNISTGDFLSVYIP